MEEIHKLRSQLGRIVLANSGDVLRDEEERLCDPRLDPPDEKQCKVLRQLLTSIYVDRVAVRADVVGAPEAQEITRSKMGNSRGVPYVALGVDGPLYVHPSSVFASRPPPAWLVFGEVQQSAAKTAVVDNDAGPPRLWLRMLTQINAAWLPKLAPTLCTFSQSSDADRKSNVLGQLAESSAALRRGVAAKSNARRTVALTPRYGGAIEDGAAGAGLGWELPPVRVIQELQNGRWVNVE